MFEPLLIVAVVVVVMALAYFLIEPVKPVENLKWSILVDVIKNIRLTWELPDSVDELSLSVSFNGKKPVVKTLEVDSTSFDFLAKAGTKVRAEIKVVFEGNPAVAAVDFVVPETKPSKPGVVAVKNLKWEVLKEVDDSNEDETEVDLDGDGEVDYFLEKD